MYFGPVFPSRILQWVKQSVFGGYNNKSGQTQEHFEIRDGFL